MLKTVDISKKNCPLDIDWVLGHKKQLHWTIAGSQTVVIETVRLKMDSLDLKVH